MPYYDQRSCTVPVKIVKGSGDSWESPQLRLTSTKDNATFRDREKMSLDSRGILRGHCTEHGCPCIGYDGGVEKKRCTNCPHPPGKHTNLSNAGSVGSSTSYVPAAYSMGSHATPHNLGSHHFGGDLHRNAGGSVPQSYQPSYVQYHQPTRPHPQLPECRANGCFNRVHCDPSLPEGLRQFSYCSPECRDRHLLPMEKVNLTVDLGDMKKKLQEVAAAEKRSPSSSTVLQRQSSSEYQSSRPAAGASSLVTGIGRGYTLGGHSSGGSKTTYSSSSTPGPSSSRATTCTSSTIPGGGGRYTSGVNGSAGGGNVLGTSSKQTKEQKSSVVIAEKTKLEQFGMLLSKKVHISDKAFGFLVVGALHRSPAHSLLQEGKIRIFDVIEKVNEKTCSELHVPEVDPQSSFDRYLRDRTVVMLRVSHHISLPLISKLLVKVTDRKLVYTHLIALRYSSDGGEDGYGLTLNTGRPSDGVKVAVRGRTAGTPAYYSGFEYGDEIRMYATASADGISDGEEGTELDNDKLDRAQSAKKSVILLIFRSVLS